MLSVMGLSYGQEYTLNFKGHEKKVIICGFNEYRGRTFVEARSVLTGRRLPTLEIHQFKKELAA